MYFEVGGRRPLTNTWRSKVEFNKKNKFQGKRRQPNMSIQLQSATTQGPLLALAKFDPQIWQEVIEKWEKDAVKVWINTPFESADMWEYMKTL